jgi:hypothetical protein
MAKSSEHAQSSDKSVGVLYLVSALCVRVLYSNTDVAFSLEVASRSQVVVHQPFLGMMSFHLTTRRAGDANGQQVSASLFISPEDGGSVLPSSNREPLPRYTAAHSRRDYFP